MGTTDVCRDLSFEERQIIEVMLKQGDKPLTVASCIQRSHSVIKNEIRRVGGRQFYTARVAQENADLRKRERANKLRKGFSEEQMDIIKQGISKKWSQNKIRALANCSHWKISNYFKEIGVDYITKNYTTFEERISVLEMQLEIVIEQLKILNLGSHGKYTEN